MIGTILVEDNRHYRNSLETLLRHAEGFAFRGSFESAESLLHTLQRESVDDGVPGWDLVLMDIELPGASGIEATRALKRILPQVPVVMLTVFEDPSVILEAISAGADGYLLKKSSAHEIRTQLHAIVKGGAPLTAGVARTVLDMLRNPAMWLDGPHTARPPGRLDLTDREQDVLRCLVQGRTYQGTADALKISVETVRTHIRAVYRKLQVHSVAEAVRRAVRERLV